MSVFYKILSPFYIFFNSKYIIFYTNISVISVVYYIKVYKNTLQPETVGCKLLKNSDEFECKNLFACDFEINKAVIIHCKSLIIKLFKSNKLNLTPLFA